MDIIGKTVPYEKSTVCRLKRLAIAKMAEAYIEETCHTCIETTTMIWSSDEQRRLSAKYKVFEQVGTLQSDEESKQ